MRNILLTGAAAAALLPLAAHAQDGADQAGPATSNPGDDIVVTASPFAAPIDQTPTIVEKVDREKILQTGGASIADALSDLPGIAATGFAAGASRPIIRGMDATRVRILEDGSGSSDVSDIGPDHGIPIDPLAARSIEVVRGAATLRYGSQAIGGVVNVLNDRVPMTLPTKAVSGEATGSYASVSDTWQGSLLGDVKLGDFALHADGFYRHADDYDTPLGTQENSFFHGRGGSVGGSYFFGSDAASHVGVSLTHYDAQYGIPSDDTYIDMRQTKILSRSSFALGGVLKTFNLDASYADYKHDEDEPGGDVVTTFKNKEFDGRAELLFARLGPVENTALGVEVQHRDYSALGEDSSYLFPSTTDSQAGYLFTDTPLSDRLKLQMSGRVEHVHVNGTPASDIYTTRDFTPLSGAIGALYAPSDAFKLGLTFSSTGRAPALPELFARGGHDGPGTYETGDPSLVIERANSLEATLRVNSGGFHFEGSLYSSWFNNYIYGDLTGRSCDDDGNCVDGLGEELKELDYRQQGAHFRGAEGELSYDIATGSQGKFQIRALADYTRATLDDGSNVPRIPPYRVGGGASWTSDRLDVGVLFLHAGRQDKAGTFDTATPGYNDLRAHIAWRPLAAYPGVELAIVGQNLTNEVQRDAAALNKDVVAMPGRNVRLVLKIATF